MVTDPLGVLGLEGLLDVAGGVGEIAAGAWVGEFCGWFAAGALLVGDNVVGNKAVVGSSVGDSFGL